MAHYAMRNSCRRTISFACMLLFLGSSVAACGPSDSNPAWTVDSGALPDAVFVDIPSDTPVDTSASLDAIVAVADSSTDAVESTRPIDEVGPEAATSCGYVDVDDLIVQCGGSYKMLGYFTSSKAGCPPYYSVAGSPGQPTIAGAISASGCSAACIWRFASAVTRLCGGKKSGFEQLTVTAVVMGCGDLYRFSEGYFDSVAAHDAIYPCP